MPSRFAFINPFDRNHCAVIAFTHLANGDERFALTLADQAHREHSIDTAPHAWDGSAPLLDRRGAGWVRGERDLQTWCRLAGLTVGPRQLEPYGAGPTLTQFARSHRAGRWLVLVRGHAVALIDGHYYGSYGPRTRVQMFVEVVAPVAPRPNSVTISAPVAADTISALIRAGLLAGQTTAQILATVMLAHPTARTTGHVVAAYRSKMRRAGELAPRPLRPTYGRN